MKNNKNNTSGFSGVNWSVEKGKWHSKIGVNYKRIHIGYYTELEDAIAAYLKFKNKNKKENEQ